MLDVNFVREHPDQVKANERKRNRDEQSVDQVLQADSLWRASLKEVEALKHRRNVVSQEINLLKKAGKNGAEKIKEMQSTVLAIGTQEEKADRWIQERNKHLRQLGNILHPKVPLGKDASQNVEIKSWGKKSHFPFPVRNHAEWAETQGWADFEASAKTSGKGFYFLQGDLALLNQALIRFALDQMCKKGYTYIEPPLLLRQEILDAAIDAGEWDQTIYRIQGEDLALIGTSEHALLGMHTGAVLPEQELPKKYFAYSMCFRKEVGSHGINEKGLWRTHQFNKVEQFIFCAPEESEKYFTELLKNSEKILQELGLPYRVIELCSGDLSLWKHRSYDLEVWRPPLQAYGEVMSLSNCTDYQARKLEIKMMRKDRNREVIHTLNNTALATSRIMVAILENFQTKEGTVKIPKVLWPYLGGMKILGKK